MTIKLKKNQDYLFSDPVIPESLPNSVELLTLNNTTKGVESRTSNLHLQGTVTDAYTKQLISDATLTFCLNGQNEPMMIKQTSVKGVFHTHTLAEGVYNISINKEGYQRQTISVVVCCDQLCDLDIELIKA